MADNIIELSIDPETAFYILVKAREFDEKTAPSTVNSGSNPTDDGDVEILEDQPDDPTLQELMAAMESQNEDAQIDLITLMWIGRGDFGIDEWSDARRQAVEMSDKHIPRYLSQTPLLSNYLEEGLSKAGYSMTEYEIDHL